MSEERRQILEMLADGKITAKDAERLLDKLADSSAPGSTPHESAISWRTERSGHVARPHKSCSVPSKHAG